VLMGGDLAQLGQKSELDLGAQILKSLKPPLRMMVGEHDWFLDMGEHWRELFGAPSYSFDHKGVHFVVLMSVVERDFWTARGMTPMERMKTVAGLDNGVQSRFEVGPEGRAWLKSDLDKVDKKTPLIVFSHSPLYKYYRPWNFWTEDADEVQALLRPFDTVTVMHGHTHQLLTNRIGNISFHGMLSTAWPWPYAPQGLPKLTIQQNRADPFSQFDGCGDGRFDVLESGLVDAIYGLWERNPVTVSASYVKSSGDQADKRPPAPRLASY
jgi:Icc protein